MATNVKSDRQELPASRDEEWARFWASLDDWPDPDALSRAHREADAWEAASDDLYEAALEREACDAEALGAAWISAVDDRERWPSGADLGSRGGLLLVGEL